MKVDITKDKAAFVIGINRLRNMFFMVINRLNQNFCVADFLDFLHTDGL